MRSANYLYAGVAVQTLTATALHRPVWQGDEPSARLRGGIRGVSR